MIMLILISANFLNFILDSIGLAEMLNNFVMNLGTSPLYTLLVVIALYVVLGLFHRNPLADGDHGSYCGSHPGQPGIRRHLVRDPVDPVD